MKPKPKRCRCGQTFMIYRGIFACTRCDSAYLDGQAVAGPLKSWPWHRVNYCKHQPACGLTMDKIEGRGDQ